MAFTFFFRDSHTLEQVTKYFLPYVTGFSKIKIWDAGCAMGPEPYTFAIMLAEKMSYFGFKNVHLDASDIDETNTFGDIITNGIYPESDLKRIPEDIFKKYFHKIEGTNDYKIDEMIRSRVKFHKHDLLSFQPFSSGYNLIICKNVLLHFQYEERIKVYQMFHKVLEPGGMIVNEQTQQMPEECKNIFEPLASDANVYRKI